MPTIFEEKGYRFFFVMADLNEPLHIHVMKEHRIAKFWFDPVRVCSNRGFREHALREMATIIERQQALIRRCWDERERSRR